MNKSVLGVTVIIVRNGIGYTKLILGNIILLEANYLYGRFYLTNQPRSEDCSIVMIWLCVKRTWNFRNIYT